MNEVDIKLHLIDYLLSKHDASCMVIGSEVSFYFGSRRADIVSVSGEEAAVYEIKSASDNIDRLSYQLQSYRDYFDKCYVVCEESNLMRVRKACPKTVGIIVVSDESTTLIRKSYHYRKHDKLVLLDSLSIAALKQLSTKARNLSKAEVCEEISQHFTLHAVRSLSRKHLYNRLKDSYLSFLNDRGKATNADDLITLSRTPPSPLT